MMIKGSDTRNPAANMHKIWFYLMPWGMHTGNHSGRLPTCLLMKSCGFKSYKGKCGASRLCIFICIQIMNIHHGICKYFNKYLKNLEFFNQSLFYTTIQKKTAYFNSSQSKFFKQSRLIPKMPALSAFEGLFNLCK